MNGARSSIRRREALALGGLVAILFAAAVLAAGVLGQAPANLAADPALYGYRPAVAPGTIQMVETLVLRDARRGKDLPLRITYPAAIAGRAPVIVWSHGAGGSKDGYEAFTSFWASYGYVVIAPSHEDSIALRRSLGLPVPSNPFELVRDASTNTAEWQSRPEDVRFILAQLPMLERRVPSLRGHLDGTRIGVGGHSFGAYTANAISGAGILFPGERQERSFRDPRVRAVLMLSPQGPGIMGLQPDSWNHISIPLMIMTGSLDRVSNGDDPMARRRPFELAPPGGKYFVWIEGANHLSFSGRLPGEFQQRIAREVAVESLAFWDAYLRGNSAALAYLQSGTFAAKSDPAASVEKR